MVYLIGAIGVSRKQILQDADKFPNAIRETIRETMLRDTPSRYSLEIDRSFSDKAYPGKCRSKKNR